MALSAVDSVTIQGRTVFGNKRITFGYVVFGNDTWPTGGLPLTAAQLGLKDVEAVFFMPHELQYFYDHTNTKLDAYACGTAGADEVQVQADGANITASEDTYFLAIGSGMA